MLKHSSLQIRHLRAALRLTQHALYCAGFPGARIHQRQKNRSAQVKRH